MRQRRGIPTEAHPNGGAAVRERGAAGLRKNQGQMSRKSRRETNGMRRALALIQTTSDERHMIIALSSLTIIATAIVARSPRARYVWGVVADFLYASLTPHPTPQRTSAHPMQYLVSQPESQAERRAIVIAIDVQNDSSTDFMLHSSAHAETFRLCWSRRSCCPTVTHSVRGIPIATQCSKQQEPIHSNSIQPV
jgi:hypothetical protein